MQLKEALAYALYMTTNTFLPNVVNAVVLFYGGTLVLAGHMSAGALCVVHALPAVTCFCIPGESGILASHESPDPPLRPAHYLPPS